MSQVTDPIKDGLQRGWKVSGGLIGPNPERTVCDVATIGSRAGAGITAELLVQAGLPGVIIAAWPLKSMPHLHPQASATYPPP